MMSPAARAFNDDVQAELHIKLGVQNGYSKTTIL
jgi:hypothetical protein